MGLGEGEGEKDVSEQIESEEQLEDARPKGEENTEDHKDCKACLRLVNYKEVL
jgi:midasin